MDAAAGSGLSTQKKASPFRRGPPPLFGAIVELSNPSFVPLANVKFSIGIGPDTGDSQGLVYAQRKSSRMA